jgi:hypothetical protein
MKRTTRREIYAIVVSCIFLSAATAWLYPLGPWGHVALGALITIQSMGLLQIGRDAERKDRDAGTVDLDNMTEEGRQKLRDFFEEAMQYYMEKAKNNE